MLSSSWSGDGIYIYFFYRSTESGLSEADSNGLTNGSEDPSDRERALREKVFNIFILFTFRKKK